MHSTKDPSITLSLEQFGPAGVRHELHVLAMRADESRTDEERLHDTSVRKFKIAGRLGKIQNAPVSEGVKGDFTSKDGSSYFQSAQGARLTTLNSPEGEFKFGSNEQGELSIVEFECLARSPMEARHTFLLGALPFLDAITFSANSPSFVQTVRVEDVDNLRTPIEYVSPYRPAQVNAHTSQIFPEMRAVYAMYREAKNSNSDFYKFLCYHKLLEGMFGSLRSNLFQTAKSKNLVLKKKRDIIPHDSEISNEYRMFAGKPIKEFFDNVLTPKFRNAVAHFTTDDGDVLNMSAPLHIDSYSGVLYITELCVRQTIENFNGMLHELHRSQ